MGGQKMVTVKMPEIYVEKLDELVKEGYYTSRSHALRQAVIALLQWHGKLPAPVPSKKQDWRLDNRVRV
jgi:Arc/MetJ-type ribon-helix-helix transcriptional regulator